MAVFTTVSENDAQQLLSTYDLGELVNLRGISAGIENTNYFLTTTRGEYVLTLFEVLTAEQLPFYIELMHYLAEHSIPVPKPQALKNGKLITSLHSKPTAIVSLLPGSYEPDPSTAHCALAGDTLAKAHLAAKDFSIYQPNLRGLAWWKQTVPSILEFLDDSQRELLLTVLAEQEAFAQTDIYKNLPFGPAHCDLFRDNVLFSGTPDAPQMGGFIDFYFAGCDTWLFDVAVSVNDWCIHRDDGSFDHAKLQAWLAAYHAVRPFTEDEHKAWPYLLQAAALRFWISRLYDFFRPREAETLKPHDPRHFERVLRSRRSADTPQLID